jgi:hypothetical protein
LTVTSEYGKVTHRSVVSGHPYRLAISDQVTYVVSPAGATVSLRPTEAYGDNLATGRAVSAAASSGDAAQATTGTDTGAGWTSASGDTTPRLTVTLAKPAVVDRVVIDTQSLGSTATGVRNYVVAVEARGGWEKVATVVGQYRNHQLQLSFAPRDARAVRITVSKVNFGGYYGGGIPPFWPAGMAGTGFLHAIEVYQGTSTPAQVNGSSLQPLLAGT